MIVNALFPNVDDEIVQLRIEQLQGKFQIFWCDDRGSVGISGSTNRFLTDQDAYNWLQPFIVE